MFLASSLEMIVIGQQMSWQKKKKRTQTTVLCFSLEGCSFARLRRVTKELMSQTLIHCSQPCDTALTVYLNKGQQFGVTSPNTQVY